jgi:hypothetical protein
MFLARMIPMPLRHATLLALLWIGGTAAAGATSAGIATMAAARAVAAGASPVIVPAIAHAAAAAAANWQVMVWTDPLTVLVDTASITTSEARTTARVLWDYTLMQNTADRLTAPYKSMIGIVVFDCVTESFGGAGSVSYSGNGGDGTAVARFSMSPGEATMSVTQPGTLGHDLVTYVCARAARHD